MTADTPTPAPEMPDVRQADDLVEIDAHLSALPSPADILRRNADTYERWCAPDTPTKGDIVADAHTLRAMLTAALAAKEAAERERDEAIARNARLVRWGKDQIIAHNVTRAERDAALSALDAQVELLKAEKASWALLVKGLESRLADALADLDRQHDENVSLIMRIAELEAEHGEQPNEP